IELQVRSGFRPKAIERLLRAQGDSLRRIADAESEWWASEVIQPAMEAGRSPAEVAEGENAALLTQLSESAMLSMFHAHQEHAGLPPAHVGLHAGPVLFQEGDYFGQTVNVASRIADYARPGEVLVSQAVVDASAGAGAAFTEIGPVELKGVTGAIHLHAAHRQ